MENVTEGNEIHLQPEFSPGNTGFMLICTALVFLMIPGVGYFYSGMARSKSALSLIMLSCWCMAIIFVQVSQNTHTAIDSREFIKFVSMTRVHCMYVWACKYTQMNLINIQLWIAKL